MPKVELTAPPTNLVSHLTVGGEQIQHELPYQLLIWFNSLFNRVGQGPFSVQGYTKEALPSPDEYGSLSGDVFSSIIFVANATGGPTLAFSDGQNWLRLSDNTTVN